MKFTHTKEALIKGLIGGFVVGALFFWIFSKGWGTDTSTAFIQSIFFGLFISVLVTIISTILGLLVDFLNK